MARKKENPTAEVLDEIQSLGDRLAEWVSTNPAIVLGTAVGVLVIAGGYGFASSMWADSLDKASAELAEVDSAYREAMGSPADSVEIVEPANAEAAREARTRYSAEYARVAQEYAGTTTGALAALEAGNLQTQLDEADAALGTWSSAAAGLSDQDTARALLLNRIAAAHEEAEAWPDAAQAYLDAASVETFPLRYTALASAARCFAEAGEVDRAIQAFDRVEAEAPDVQIPDFVRARLIELRAARQAS